MLCCVLMVGCETVCSSVEKKKETITESAGRQQKKKIGKKDSTSCCSWSFFVHACSLHFFGGGFYVTDRQITKHRT